jgi:AcrR family transcriptional regulator
MIAEGGYFGFSISAIATRCGVSRAGVLHHFASKEDLLVAVLRHRDEVDIAELSPGTPTRASAPEVREVLRALVRRNLSQPEIVRLYAVLEAESLADGHPARDYFASRLVETRMKFAELVSLWHPNPAGFAIEVLAFMDGLQLNWLRDGSLDFEAVWDDFAGRLFEPYL